MFADLAGFTAWSSKRTPCEVFELLEAIYGCFDKLAERRKVFKQVENRFDSCPDDRCHCLTFALLILPLSIHRVETVSLT